MFTLPVRVGTIDLTFHQVSSAIVQAVLRRAGHRVDVVEKPHEELFGLLGRGELDLVVSAWLPGSHGRYLESVETEVVGLGELYHPYALWGVPDYVPEPTVREVADLARPDVAARMTKRIQGVGAGAGISRFSAEIVEHYGLADQGYEFRVGTQYECELAFESAVAEHRWVVLPLWRPQHLHQVHRIRELVEPAGLLRGQDVATVVAGRAAMSVLAPATIRVLKRMSLGNAAVTEMDYRMNRLGEDADQVADGWMRANRDQVTAWYSS